VIDTIGERLLYTRHVDDGRIYLSSLTRIAIHMFNRTRQRDLPRITSEPGYNSKQAVMSRIQRIKNSSQIRNNSTWEDSKSRFSLSDKHQSTPQGPMELGRRRLRNPELQTPLQAGYPTTGFKLLRTKRNGGGRYL